MNMRKLVYGVGINDADYCTAKYEKINGNKVRVWVCPFYEKWANLLIRCYSHSYQSRYPTYAGCEVCAEWLIFSRFKAWMSGLDWFGLELDKDLLRPGNKVYGPENCVFVSRRLNRFTVDAGAIRGDWPIGVSWDKRKEQFKAGCSNPFTGKHDNLGYFDCPNAAHEAWRQRKHELACQYADMQPDSRLAEALRSRFA